jgi:hypothetical protein
MTEQNKNSIPFISFGNDELADKPALGTSITCPHCNQIHDIKYGDEVLPDGTRKPSKLMAFYKCGKKIYLAGIDGKSIINK